MRAVLLSSSGKIARSVKSSAVRLRSTAPRRRDVAR